MDDTKINPSPPPAEPVDVDVTPAPPPRDPVDVEVRPVPPPAEPFDVPTVPVGPPAEPFDVPVGAVPPPSEPFDVQTSPSLPPWEAFDVPVDPSPVPEAPFDVPVDPLEPPAEPFDVPTSPLPPPLDPISVEVEPMVLPAEPFDVAVSPSPAPAEPVDIFVSPPPWSGLPPNPTTKDLVNAIEYFDEKVAKLLMDVDEVDSSPGAPYAGALDPRSLVNWYKTYFELVGPGGLAKFVSEQALLYSKNPLAAKVFDPSYFVKMLIPGMMGHATTTIDTQAGFTAVGRAISQDAVETGWVSARSTWYGPQDPNLADQNVYDQSTKSTDGQEFTVDGMVDAALGESSPDSRFMTTREGVARFDAAKYFEQDGTGRVKALAKSAAQEGRSLIGSPLHRSAFADGVVRVPLVGEDPDGSVISDGQDPSEKVLDDDARVPLSFTDLRKDPVKNGHRSVFFRPLNLNIAMSLAPEYSENVAFGRVDPAVTYARTTRTYSVSFEVHAFAPEDLSVMYNKLVWLSSMCYPSYGEDSLMKSGPVVRMRVGDLASTDRGGVAGVIRSLNFDFADALWEIKKGFKVPRSYQVSLDFTVLHDGPVGILNGVFGVLKIPPIKVNKDTNLAGDPTAPQDSEAEIAQVLSRKFMGFGDPTKR